MASVEAASVRTTVRTNSSYRTTRRETEGTGTGCGPTGVPPDHAAVVPSTVLPEVVIGKPLRRSGTPPRRATAGMRAHPSRCTRRARRGRPALADGVDLELGEL